MDEDADAPLSVLLDAADGPVSIRVWPRRPLTAPGPVLLACHGWTDSGEVFGPLATALDRRWTVVAPDAPGHGGTPLRPGPYVVADHVTSALAVLDALPEVAGSRPARSAPAARDGAPEVAGSRRARSAPAVRDGPPEVAGSRRARGAVLLGHSMGALTAARLAAARPGLVRALVLEDPARTTLRRPRSAARMRTWLLGLRAGDHLSRVSWAAANHPDWPADELDPWAHSKVEVDLAQLDGPVDWGEPLPALLTDVRVPVLIVHGDVRRGGIVSATAAGRCAAACPAGAAVFALPVGHCPRREARRAFVAALSAVLDQA